LFIDWGGRVLNKYIKELSLLRSVVKPIYKEAIKNVVETKNKGEQDIVTSTDLFIEEKLIEAIKEVFPNDSFHSEEFNNHSLLKNRTWVIDPIDGTSNYQAGLGLYVVQIAFYDQGDIVLSYVYIPSQDSIYYAVMDEGAYLNDHRYFTKDRVNASFLISMVGLTHKNEDKTYYHRIIDLAIKKKYKMRMLGSIGLELVLTSEGIFDFFYTNVTNFWDLFPGLLLMKEAGAIIKNESGEDYKLGDLNVFVWKDESVFNEFKKELLK